MLHLTVSMVWILPPSWLILSYWNDVNCLKNPWKFKISSHKAIPANSSTPLIWSNQTSNLIFPHLLKNFSFISPIAILPFCPIYLTGKHLLITSHTSNYLSETSSQKTPSKDIHRFMLSGQFKSSLFWYNLTFYNTSTLHQFYYANLTLHKVLSFWGQDPCLIYFHNS